ncbi:MAG: serine/threonine-protein kinase [Actinomycetota bacterium]|nr:serine/threonine-protein kinase [Actinomycetota bacterium]
MDRGLFLERFEVIEELGAGGFARVYRAFDRKMEREVAIKEVAKGGKSDLRTMREINTTALLKHPNIVTLYEFVEDDDNFYLIMEYIDGLTLTFILETQGALFPEEAVAVASQVALALEYAHQNEVIHRDIKPDNIMLLADGRIKVMDFGIARLKKAPRLTVDKELLGSLGYVSPEQAKGDYVDEATDIFALGVLIYTMLAGENPFEAETAAATIYKTINIEPPPLSRVVPGVPKELDHVIAEALNKNPDKRQRTVTSLRYKLERLLQAKGRPKRTLSPLFARAAGAYVGEGGLFDEELAFIKEGLEEMGGKRALVAARLFSAALLGGFLFLGLKGSSFFSEEIGAILSLVTFFVALFSPLLGLVTVALAAALAIGAFSFSLSLIFLALASLYILNFARSFPEASASFLAAPLLGRLGLSHLFPLAIGVIMDPIPAAIGGAAGAFALEAYDLFAGSAQLALKIKATTNPFSTLFILLEAFIEDPALLLMPLIWAAAAFLVALLAKNKRFLADLIAAGLGGVVLLLGEMWLPTLHASPPLDLGKALQRVSFSFIMLIIFIAIFHYIKITWGPKR